MKVFFSSAVNLNGTGLGYISRCTATQLSRRGLLAGVAAFSGTACALEGDARCVAYDLARKFRWLDRWPISKVLRRLGLEPDLRWALFDRFCSRLADSANVVHYHANQGFWQSLVAHRNGAKAVADNPISHPDSQSRLLLSECERFGVRVTYSRVGCGKRWRRTLAESDMVLVSSRFAYESFLAEGFPRDRLSLVPYGVDCAMFHPSAKPEVPFRVLHVGQIGLRKGVPYVLEAWRRLSLPNSELVLVGWVAEDCVRVVETYRKQCSFTMAGPLHDMQKLAEHYRRGSVFVAASIEDGFAMTVTEAMASGLPVIVSENTGAKDVVTEGVNGFIVPIRDPDAIARRLQWLYDHPAERAAMGAAARRRAEQQTWELYGDRLVETYRRVLAGEPGLSPDEVMEPCAPAANPR